MNRKIYILAVLFVLIGTSSYAQSVVDIFRVSQENSGYSTARSSAMGGAFTSLGADPASININPAGLGMYRTSEISITPSVKISSITSDASYPNFNNSIKDNKTTFNLNNFSAIINLYNNRSSYFEVFNMTLGMSYNKSESFRAKSTAIGAPEGTSIGDMFAAQLYDINPGQIYNEDNSSEPYNTFGPGLWGAILSYNTGLLYDNKNQYGDYVYTLSYLNDNNVPVGSLIRGDEVIPQIERFTTGSNDEYAVSLGMNIGDILYIGTTLGASVFRYEEYNAYKESALASNRGDLQELRYGQRLTMQGEAFSFKFGATVQPVDGLKIGAAIHAPKIYNISEDYNASMDCYYVGNEYFWANSLIYANDYKIQTPARFLAGISYMINNHIIISADYERVWYNKMKVKDISYAPGEVTFEQEIQAKYAPSNNFKFGAEFNVSNGFFLRGGYAYYGSPLKNYKEDIGRVQNISGGLGYRDGRFIVDLSFVNINRKLEPYRFYGQSFGQEVIESVGLINTKQSDNNIILTLGVKF